MGGDGWSLRSSAKVLENDSWQARLLPRCNLSSGSKAEAELIKQDLFQGACLFRARKKNKGGRDEMGRRPGRPA